ncbi:MAG: hypothetical protein IPH68_04475 [Chitinophagaceae bacterium]|nr:hypothetical protein [Chitinophagaceae bacterium]
MKKVIITMGVMTAMLTYLLSSCYKNKEDIIAVPGISFRNDVVPIMVSGGCGCHNNGIGTRAVQFSHADTIFYDAILGRVGLLDAWVNGGIHPGAGSIYFTTTQENIIKQWIAEGAKDDGGGCTVTGVITYTAKILPLYTTSCKGSTCHGGIASNLTYSQMAAKKDVLTTMMNSSGNNGHPGGALSLSSCTVKLFNEWIAQGTPQ